MTSTTPCQSAVANVFDLETGPLDDATLNRLCPPFDPRPFSPFQDPGPFDPESVKYGQMKDPEKKKAKCEEAREKHESDRAKLAEKNEKARAEWETDRQAGDVQHLANFKAKAGLSARTGFIVALGVGRPRIDGEGVSMGGFLLDSRVIAGDEQDILRKLWNLYTYAHQNEGRFIGWNILGFDLPFAVQRSRILGVPVPASVVAIRSGRANWSPCLVDLMPVWTCGAFGSAAYCKLDDACAAMGLSRKPVDSDGVEAATGASFHRLWNGTPDERAQAEAYLRNDLMMTWRAAERMGVV